MSDIRDFLFPKHDYTKKSMYITPKEKAEIKERMAKSDEEFKAAHPDLKKEIPLDTLPYNSCGKLPHGYITIRHSSQQKWEDFETPNNTKSIFTEDQEDGTVIEILKSWDDEPLFTDEGYKW